MEKIILRVGADGSVLGRRPFGGGTIALQRLQFSSSEGVAFAVSSQRVPQIIVYETVIQDKEKPINKVNYV